MRPGGRIALLDAAVPTSAIARAGHKVWFEHAVPLIGGLLSDREAYRYLPDSVEYLRRPPGYSRYFADGGFVSAQRRTLSAGATQLLTATRPAENGGPGMIDADLLGDAPGFGARR